MRKSRGQASLEFLMTYGWAIIVISVVLVVLWQWGAFNPQSSTEQTYTGFWGVMPVDYNYKSDGNLALSLKNNINGNIQIIGINVTGPNGEIYSDPDLPNAPINLSAGKTYLWNQNISSEGSSNGAYNMVVTIAYFDDRIGTNTTFKSSGTLQGTTEGVFITTPTTTTTTT